ncbi:MAG: hypothetical protein ACOZNI_29185, partial [Myxococcota bacterium]
VVLFFAATSTRGGVVAAAIVVGLAALGLLRAGSLLVRVEAAAGEDGVMQMRALLLAWAALATLVGLRLFTWFTPHLL